MTLRIRPVLRPLKAWLSDVIGGTGHHTQFRHGVELALRSDDGRIGLGEASPLPNFSNEQLSDVEAELSHLGRFELELPSNRAESRESISKALAPMGLNSASARFACEGALIDLLAQHFEVPAATLVAAMARQATADAPKTDLEVSRLVPMTDLPRLIGAARHAWGRGYRTIKLKVGPVASFTDECNKLEALRDHMPQAMKLRLDPNGCWPAAELPEMLDHLARLSVELVEEPAPASELSQLERSPVELAIDESLREVGALDRLAPHLARIRLRVAIVKPALLGFFDALDIAMDARALGLDVVVTHLFDGPIGHATAASLALAVGTECRAHGLGPHPGLLLCPERRILGLGGGHLVLSEKPGLPLTEVSHC